MKGLFCGGLCLLCLLFASRLKAQQYYELKIIRPRPASSSGQQIVCVSPYQVSECERQITILQAVLTHYHAEKLGKWTWVLVGSADWKHITDKLHLDPDSPAFSHLEMRQTFLEEALLTPKPARQVELLKKWHISFDRFLDFAVSHELGHALCDDPDEIKAEQAGQRLREGTATVCDARRTTPPQVAAGCR